MVILLECTHKRIESLKLPNKTLSEIIGWHFASRKLDEKIKWTYETKKFLEEDAAHFVLYAVDTDIVKCYCAPFLLGSPPSESKNIPYGVIFPPDQKNVQAASAITFIIAKYIFFSLNNDWPVLQLPTQAEETIRVYDAVAENAAIASEQFASISDLLDNVSQKFIKEINGKMNASKTEESNRDILEIINKLGELLTGKEADYLLEMRNYLQIISESTLISTDEASNIFKNKEEISGLGEALSSNNINDFINEYLDREQWIKYLVDDKNNLTKKKEEDAYALARLETINRKLAPLGGRLILITGAKSIINAAKNNKGDQFLKKYIRHFHSFLPLAFGYAEGTNEALDFILGYNALKDGDGDNKKDLDYDTLEEEWIEYRDKVIQSSLLNSNKLFSDILDALREKFAKGTSKENFASELIKASENIKKEMITLRTTLIAEFAKVGISSLQIGKRSPYRNAPNVKFDSYTNANNLFKLFLKDGDLSSINLGIELEKLKKDCISQEIGINDLGYLYFLITAAIFAALNRWNVTEDMAGYAVMIAEKKPITKAHSSISGREAYYLLASAKRLNAHDIKDFEKVDDLLNKANEALELDKKNRPDLNITKCRFDSERIATEISKWHYQLDKNITIKIPDSFIEEIYSRLEEVQKKDSDDLSTIVQYAINGLQALSLYLLSIGDNLSRDKIVEILTRYANEINAFNGIESLLDKKIQKTYLMEAYWLFGNIIHNIESQNITITKEKIDYFFGKVKFIAKYDESRFPNLHNLCIKIYVTFEGV